jgi:glycosyltransferase involved in cell wall biosynthesis
MISVIIPVYNSEDILESCLKGVFASDISQFECIVVNDGSTDNSIEIAKQFPVKIVENPAGPEGPANARNHGAEHAQGEILFFIDADVVIKEDTISKVSNTFEDNPQIAALFGSYDEDPNDRGFLSQYKNLLHHYVHQRGHENAITFWSGCGAVKRDVFFEMGGFDAKSYPKPSIEDIELGYRLRNSGYQIIALSLGRS